MLLGRQLEPGVGQDPVLDNALAARVHLGQVVLGAREPLLGGLLVPAGGLLRVGVHALT